MLQIRVLWKGKVLNAIRELRMALHEGGMYAGLDLVVPLVKEGLPFWASPVVLAVLQDRERTYCLEAEVL